MKRSSRGARDGRTSIVPERWSVACSTLRLLRQMVRLPIVDQMISLVRKPARGGGKPPAPNVREDRLRGGFDQAPVGLAYVAPDGHWLQYNERFRDTVGYTREQLGRISFNDLTHPDDAKKELAL